ncbi:PREDICTED: uncharacterized protein LOC104774120 [Camelina sativa]|nr:PREDICTED: uncharacterized protein LOC104774120 [Camelina sativa]
MLLGYVNGTISRPSTTRSATGPTGATEEPNPEFAKWIRNDQLVMAWIFGSLSEPSLQAFYGMHSSQEVWSALAKKFNRVSTTRMFELKNRLRACIKYGRPMDEYLSELKQVFDQLDSIGFPMSELEKIHSLLTGLGKEYESIATVIEHSMDAEPGPCYEDVVFKVIAFDDKLKTNSAAPPVTPHLAFQAEKTYFDRGSSNRGGRSGSGGGYRGRGNYSTRGRGFQQHGSSQNSGSSRPTCQICGKYGHSAAKCYNRYNEDFHSRPTYCSCCYEGL